MAQVLQDRGCEVTFAPIEFTDPRYRKRFDEFPMPKPFREVVSMIPSELRDKPVQISIPDPSCERKYDLVVVGAPTWWLSTDAPMRTFLESDAAAERPQGERVRRSRVLPALLEAQPKDRQTQGNEGLAVSTPMASISAIRAGRFARSFRS